MRPQVRLIIADSEHCADLLWTTRFFVPDPVIYLEIKGRKRLLVSDLEYSRARHEARVHQVIPLSRYAKKLPMEVLDALLRKHRVRRLCVPPYLGIHEANFLKRKGYRLEVTNPFFPKRALKGPEEKKHIVNSLRAAEAGIREAITLLRNARIRGHRIYSQGRVVTSELLKNTINLKMMSLGYVGHKTIVAGGRQGADPHRTGSGPIPPHWPIVMDVFPRSEKSGYFGDITRTVIKGKSSPTHRKMYEAVRKAQSNGIKLIRHGIKVSKVHEIVQKTLDEAGFKTTDGKIPEGFIHSTGHGLGLEIHEPPRLGKQVGAQHQPEAGPPPEDAAPLLKAGHVVTVEPGLYYQKLGGIRIEDVVYVTRKGCEVLTKIPKIFVIP